MSKIDEKIRFLKLEKESLQDKLNIVNDKLIKLEVTEAIYFFNNEFKKHSLPLPDKILIESTSEYNDDGGYYYCLGGLSLINSEYKEDDEGRTYEEILDEVTLDEMTNEYDYTLYESINESISDIVWGQNGHFSYEFDMDYSDCEVD